MPYRNYETEVYETLGQLCRAAEQRGEATCLLQKENGQYRSISYRRFCDDVSALGTELLSYGLFGAHVLLIGENSREWVMSFLAVAAGVGVIVPLDAEISAEELKKIAKESDATAVIYSEKVSDRIVSLGNCLTRIPFDALTALIAKGEQRIADGDDSFRSLRPDPDTLCALFYTSGTSGRARGVMLSHRNLCFSISNMCKMVYLDDRDIFLSVLPLYHAYEAVCGFLCPLSRGASVAFCEGLSHLSRNMREVHPTVMLCVPLLLETLLRRTMANIERRGLREYVQKGIRVTDAIPNPSLRLAAKRKYFSAVHKSFGGSMRLFAVGGTVVSPETLSGMRALGFPVLQGYGLTECAPIVAMNRDSAAPNDRAVGMAMPNTLLDICNEGEDGTGEIRIKGDNVMLGYYKNPALTAEVIRDGWFHTGDLGYLDADGYLYLTGRQSNVIRTARGKCIYPEELEELLCRSRLVAEAVVLGFFNSKKQDIDTVAVIRPDLEAVRSLLGSDYTDADLDLALKKTVSEVNCAVAYYKRIDLFLLCQEEFPKNTSQKIIRKGLSSRFQPLYKQAKRTRKS